MRTNVKTLLAALLSTAALALPAARAQSLDAGVPGAELYIANSSDITSPVNIYVDGQLFASNVFNDSSQSMFAKDITTGSHNVIVTYNYQTPGENDILNTTITVPAGGSTLTLANTVDTSNGANYQTGYELDLSNAAQ